MNGHRRNHVGGPAFMLALVLLVLPRAASSQLSPEQMLDEIAGPNDRNVIGEIAKRREEDERRERVLQYQSLNSQLVMRLRSGELPFTVEDVERWQSILQQGIQSGRPPSELRAQLQQIEQEAIERKQAQEGGHSCSAEPSPHIAHAPEKDEEIRKGFGRYVVVMELLDFLLKLSC